jgi:putative DNA primase/helicase
MEHQREHELIQENMYWLQEQGALIIPLCSHDHEGTSNIHRGACNSPGKAPLLGKWQQAGRPTAETIDEWLDRYPSCNVGLVLGLESGLVGIDVDGPGGEEALREWSGGDLPTTWEFTTPGGGRRLLYSVPQSLYDQGLEKLGNPARQSRGADHEECRLMGDGRQTVLPPSIHPNGKRYAWTHGHVPGEIDTADMPQWMIDAMTGGTAKADAADARPATAKGDSKPLDLDTEGVFARLSEGCPRFRDDWADQQGAGVDYDAWFFWTSLLVTAGFPEAARAFSRASKKHDRGSEAALKDLEAKAGSVGMARCTTFGCDLEQVTECFGEPRTNEKGAVTNSPGRFLFGGAEKADKGLSPEAALSAAEAAVAKVESGEDTAAHLENDATRAFAVVRAANPADFERLRTRLKACKASVTALDSAVGRAERQIVNELRRKAQEGSQSLKEKGFVFFDDGVTVKGVNGNIYARYVLKNKDLAVVAQGERIFRYEGGVWKFPLPLELSCELRDFLHQDVPDLWDTGIERVYTEAIKREAAKFDDANPRRDVVNLRNGMLDLATFELLPHAKEYYSTVQVPIDFDRGADCPKFRAFLDQIFDGDGELVSLVQEMMGYCLTAETRAHKAFILTGTGSNGKSVLIDVLTRLCGAENVSAVSLKEISQQQFSKIDLVGKTVNIATENEIDVRGFETDAFKSIVSGDLIRVERKYEDGFAYRPYCKLVLAFNKLPYTKDQSYGFLRRLIIIPFGKTFEGEQDNKHLKEELHEELSGILNFAIEGLKRLYANDFRFQPSAAAERELRDYRDEINPLHAFVGAFFEPASPQHRHTRKAVRAAFDFWCGRNGVRNLRELPPKTFWKAFRAVCRQDGFALTEGKSNGVDFVHGLQLRDDAIPDWAGDSDGARIVDLFRSRAEDGWEDEEETAVELPASDDEGGDSLWDDPAMLALEEELEEEAAARDFAMEYYYLTEGEPSGLEWDEWLGVWEAHCHEYAPVLVTRKDGFVHVTPAPQGA